MRASIRSAFLVFLMLFSSAGLAVDLRPVEVRRGTEGLAAVPLTIANAAGEPIVCVGELAHWYSAELGRAAAREEMRVPLWFDPETGTYTVLNDSDENMPVEALWC